MQHTHTHPQAHLDALEAAHPDQQVEHLRSVHGWSVFPSEETDRLTLRAMHAVAHENTQHTNCPPATPPCQGCGIAEPLIEPGALYVVHMYRDGWYHQPCREGRR